MRERDSKRERGRERERERDMGVAYMDGCTCMCWYICTWHYMIVEQ